MEEYILNIFKKIFSNQKPVSYWLVNPRVIPIKFSTRMEFLTFIIGSWWKFNKIRKQDINFGNK